MTAQLIYMTASSEVEAEKIVAELLKKKLIACANIFPAIQSHYVWKDQLEKQAEIPVLMKSLPEHFAKIEETVLGLHSYECPCLIALPISNGHSVFLDWISKSCPL